MRITVYVEGGGDRTELNRQCRKGFHDLLDKAGFRGRQPKVVPCGPRNRAFRSFERALRNGDGYPILLVDSEDPVADADRSDVDPSGAWRHLSRRGRDDWTRPPGAKDDQAQLMVTTMETWLLADRRTFIACFPDMNANALPPDTDLEKRSKPDVSAALRNATQSSRKGRYHKGSHSFDLLGKIEPKELKSRLPHFRHFIKTLDARLPRHRRAPGG